MGIKSDGMKNMLGHIGANLKIELKRHNSMDTYKHKSEVRNTSMILLGDASDGSLSLHDNKIKNNSGMVHSCVKPPLPKVERKSVFQKMKDKLFRENKSVHMKDLRFFGKNKSLANDAEMVQEAKKPISMIEENTTTYNRDAFFRSIDKEFEIRKKNE